MNFTICSIRKLKEVLLKDFAGTDVLKMIDMFVCSNDYVDT